MSFDMRRMAFVRFTVMVACEPTSVKKTGKRRSFVMVSPDHPAAGRG